jgi:hypothetical protein
MVNEQQILQHVEDIKHKQKVITFDDKLEIKALKTDTVTGRKLPFHEYWWRKQINEYIDGELNVKCYYNKNTRDYKSIDDITNMDKLLGYVPKTDKVIPTRNKNIKILSASNEIKVRLWHLENNFDSRYKQLLDVLIALNDKGVFKYDLKQYEAKYNLNANRNIKACLRYVLNSYFNVNEYEWDIVFKGKLGKLILENLIEVYGSQYQTTVYMQGKSKYKGRSIMVKAYNITAKQDNRDTNLDTDRYKIEWTLYKPYFQKNSINISDLTTQPKILVKIRKDIADNFKVIYNKINWKIQGEIMRTVKATTYDEMEQTLFDTNRTKHSIEDRLDYVEKEVKKIGSLETRIAILESKSSE